MNIVINLNKEHGATSHDAVTAAKKLFKVRKAGHAGTLDPAATGVLLVCLNEATKITGYLSDLSKEYVVTAKLGESTDTLDAEGEVIRRVTDLNVAASQVQEVLERFVGEIEQTPPMYSAIKLSGTPLYKFARKGIEVAREKRRVIIYSLELLGFDTPVMTLRVACSKGTYIRSLIDDIGNTLDVGAHVTGLVRTRIGDFTIEKSARIEELPGKTGAMYAIDGALQHLPEVTLEGDPLRKAQHGNPVPVPLTSHLFDLSMSRFVRLKDQGGRLLGIGRIGKESIKIERLFNM